MPHKESESLLCCIHKFFLVELAQNAFILCSCMAWWWISQTSESGESILLLKGSILIIPYLLKSLNSPYLNEVV